MTIFTKEQKAMFRQLIKDLEYEGAGVDIFPSTLRITDHKGNKYEVSKDALADFLHEAKVIDIDFFDYWLAHDADNLGLYCEAFLAAERRLCALDSGYAPRYVVLSYAAQDKPQPHFFAPLPVEDSFECADCDSLTYEEITRYKQPQF